MTELTPPSPPKTGPQAGHTPMMAQYLRVTFFVNADKAVTAIFNPPVPS